MSLSIKSIEIKANSIQTYKNGSEKEWCSVSDAMILFNKNRAAIYTAFARADVPKKKIGKEVYFEQNAVTKLLRKN